MFKRLHFPSTFNALTMAELLVVVVISGLLATLLAPKLIQHTKTEMENNVMRSTILALGHLTEKEFSESATPDLYAAARDQLGILRACPNASVNGCWPSAAPAHVTDRGVVLKNGAVVIGLESVTTHDVDFFIDANGDAAPNTEGIDRMHLRTCSDIKSCSTVNFILSAAAKGYKVEPGVLVPATSSEALYNQIMGL